MKCSKCSKSILPFDEYLYDKDIPVHVRCYLCSNCNQSLSGQCYYRYKDPRHHEDEYLYCERCYLRIAPVCFHCLKRVDELSLIYGQHIYHPNCFRCDRCQIPFKGALLFPYNDHQYCSTCYEQVQEYFRPAFSKILQMRCAICRKLFQPADLITKHEIDCNENGINIHYIHNTCLVCELCSNNLSNSDYFVPNKCDEDPNDLRFQCERCHQLASEICSNCFKWSDETMIIFNKRWYHEKCFVCGRCQNLLQETSTIIIESNGLFCEQCLQRINEQ